MPTFFVSTNTDAAGDTSMGVNIAGVQQGSLRQAINYANANPLTTITINFNGQTSAPIMLAADLPLLAQSTVINTNVSGAVIIDGGNQFRGLLISGVAANGRDAAATTVTISNLTFQNVVAQGGAGANGGGGGLGAGGAVFVGPAATVVLTDVGVSGARAVGGTGAAQSGSEISGGGGGLGGAAGAAPGIAAVAGSGGGGILFDGGAVSSGFAQGNAGGGGGGVTSAGDPEVVVVGGSGRGGAGGAGLGGLGGGGGGANNASGGGAAGGVGASAGDGAFSGGGAGGFGGGGGGAGGNGRNGGIGGFGGGGGGGAGGNGGFGGGGGAEGSLGGGLAGDGGFGGGGGLSVNGPSGRSGFGASAPGSTGGNGAGLGGAVFVAAGGSLTINGATTETGGAATQGGGGTGYGAGVFFEGGTAAAPANLSFGAGTQSVADAIADLNGTAGNTTTGNGLGGTGGVTALAKSGSGTLTLSGANTYTGGTTVSGGATVVLGTSSSSLGSGGVVLNGGTLAGASGASVTLVNAVQVAAAGGGLRNLALTSGLSGAGALTISGPVGLGADDSAFTGSTLISTGGILSPSATAELNANVLGANAPAFLSPNSAFRIDTDGQLILGASSQTIRSLADGPSGGGVVRVDSAFNTQLNLIRSLNGLPPAAPPTLSVGRDNTSTTFSGVIRDDGGATLAIAKTGAGVFTLTGANTFTGATTVSGGVLAVDGAFASAITVANGGTLIGTGTDTAGLTVQAGGTFAPGDTTGTFTGASLTMAVGSTFAETIAGTAAYGRASFTTAPMVGATLSLTYTGGAEAYGTAYVILSVATPAAVAFFANVGDGSLLTSGGHTFRVNETATTVTLTDVTDTAPPPVAGVSSPTAAPTPMIAGAPASQTYTSGSLPLVPGAALSDAGATQLLNVQVTLGGYQAGDALSAAVAGTGVSATFSSANGVLTLQGTASLATYDQILQSLAFSHTGAAAASTRTVTIQAVDTAGAVGTAVEQLALAATSATPGATTPSQAAGLAAEFANLSRAAATDVGLTDPFGSLYGQAQAEAQIAAKLDAGRISSADAQGQLFHLVDGTTSLAELSYAFFTGRTPTAAGLNYLVNSPTNPTDLNDAYYQGFTTENRYINFAVNLATGSGQGAAAFQAAYGPLSLSDATARAYAAVFGSAPAAGKIDAILNAQVSNGLGGTETRAQYFADVSGGTAAAQKAAAIGFLLADAVKENLGPYAAADQNFLADLAHGTAAYNVDLIGAYVQAHTLTGPPVLDGALES